ncbi:MAG: acyltransferase, partial [Gemmatimonadaceae bacterium]
MSRQKHLPALDGLRAVAVFIVIAYHADITKGIPADLGVTLFFVLSGFLITWLLLREFDESGTISIRRFYVRRTLRIFPAYYVFAVISFALDTVLGKRWTIGLITVTFTYLVNYYNALFGHPTTSVAHAWSLAVEEQFYLLWPLVCLALLKRSRATATTAVACMVLLVAA